MTSDWKEQAQRLWNAEPCGRVEGEEGSLEYFLRVEQARYEEYAPWMEPHFEFSKYSNEEVLELGFGQGTDLVQFAKAGARCFGVDVTQRHLDLARRNFEVRGLSAELHLEDAANLHFEDESFDVVYSFGVLHHTEAIRECLGEAHRVLRPGGELILALYHRWSAYHLFSVLLTSGLLRGRLPRLGYRGLLSTVEQGADGVTCKPWVELYSRREMGDLIAGFRLEEIAVKHLESSHFGVLRYLIPGSLARRWEAKLGWYVIAKAVK